MEREMRSMEERFTFEDRVGSGAFGEVFRGIDRATGETVAIKRLISGDADQMSLHRFRMEVRLLARVNHPHVVRYIAHGLDGHGKLCLVLEWLQGQNLAQRLRTQPLRLEQALDVVRQAAEALGALHDAGIVHRDVKPSNFFVTELPDGSLDVKAIDLGIARSVHDVAVTVEGLRVGTPAYMSPEQARGEASITERTDVYSLGVVLFELLAGRRPFTGRDPFALMAQIVLQRAPRIREIVPSLPESLDEIVACAMHRDPSERYPSARAMAAALTDVQLPVGFTVASAEEPMTVAIRPQLVMATAEQRVVTTVFAGFQGSPDENSFQRFSQIVSEHGGVTHRLIGRRAVAVFGHERSSGDEALRAARAALEAGAMLEGARFALATCRVDTDIAGLSAEAIERGADQLEKPGQGPRVDVPTARMLESYFVIEQEGPHAVLRGERSSLDTAGPQLFGRATPYIGREREMAILDAVFAESMREPIARGALMTGPPGVGKSRIRFEWIRSLRARHEDLVVLSGRGDPVTSGSPFGVLAGALKRHAGIVEGDPIEARRAKFCDALLRNVALEQRTRVGAFLGELAGVHFDDRDDDALRAARRDPVLRGDAMRLAFVDWLIAECAVAPVLLVIEDLQWVDRSSLKFVDAALRSLGERRFMVLSIGRAERGDAFRQAMPSATQEITVPALTKKAAQRLVHAVLRDASAQDVDRMVERADGNPFHLEELMRAIAAGAGDALPETVLGMIQARLDVLGPDAKRVLRVASVFGQTFWRGAIASLGSLDKVQATEQLLTDLVASEVILRRPSSTFRDEIEYAFRNSVLRDAAYAMLTDADRSNVHALAGAWLEQAGSTDAAQLAEHYERGRNEQAAARWHVAAAESALGGNDFTGAIEATQRSVRCGATGDLAGQALLIESEALRWHGDLESCLLCASEALAQLEPGSVRWYRALGEAFIVAGRLARTAELESLVAGWRSIRPAADAISAAVATGARGVTVMITAGSRRMSDALYVDVRALADSNPLEPAARARIAQAEAQYEVLAGNMAKAIELTTASMNDFRLAGDERNVAVQRGNVANQLIDMGRYAEAEIATREVLQISERLGLSTMNKFLKHSLGRLLGARGEYAAGIAAVEEALEYYRERGETRMEAVCRSIATEILLRSGDLERAEKEARRAVEIAREVPIVFPLAAAELTDVLLATGRADEALAQAREGMTQMKEFGRVEGGEALLRVVYAEALHGAGRIGEAHLAISDARARLEIAAEILEDPTHLASYRREVPEHRRTYDRALEWLGTDA